MSTYNIKLEDKAAFINRLDKLGIGVDSYEIKDDKLKGTFEFTVDDPAVDSMVKAILKQSPKINRIKEMENKKKLTKEQLTKIVREELANTKSKKLNEVDLTPFIPLIGPLAGAIAGWLAIKANKDYIKKQLGSDATDKEIKATAAAALAKEMQQKYGGSSR
jgi:hypothetical protein